MEYKDTYNDEISILEKSEKIKNNKLSKKEKTELEKLKNFCSSYPIDTYIQ